MYRTFVVAALSLSLSLAVATGQETHLASIPAQVTVLQKHLEKWEDDLMRIDIGALSVSYQEGKLLDENRSLCLKRFKLLKQEIPKLKANETLVRDVHVIACVDDLQSVLMELSHNLSGLVTNLDQHSQETAMRWADELMSMAQEIEGFSEPLNDKLDERLYDADRKLSKCGSASPTH